MSRLGLNRRNFIRTGLAAAAAPMFMPTSLFGQKPGKASATERKTFLFLDWYHVNKGELQVKLDPARISEAGKKLLNTYEKDFHKTFEQSSHGFKPKNIPHGIRIVQEPAERSVPWLVGDQPWEKSATSPTVIDDGGRLRCWYSVRLKSESAQPAVEKGQVMEVSGSATAYAESKDGFNWSKPKLNILSFQGSTENNLVSPWNNGGSVFLDEHGPAEERYKGFDFDKLSDEESKAPDANGAKYGLFGCSSPDGYHWKKHPKALIKYFADTTNIAGWDKVMGKYVGYFRHHLGGRSISRAETTDFWNWPAPEVIQYPGPMDSPSDDYYTNCYTTYPGEPSLRLMFPAIYHHDSDTVDVRMEVSRDGRSYQWLSLDPIIKSNSGWDSGSLYAQPNLVHLPDGRLALPYDAYNTTHNEAWFHNFYSEYDTKSGVAWALWKDGRLAGIEANELGAFTMIASVFRGTQIELNARTSRAGSVELELRERGKPLEGFTFGDNVPFSDDKVWEAARWKGKSDLSSLRGKSIEVAIRLRSAKIFACRFV